MSRRLGEMNVQLYNNRVVVLIQDSNFIGKLLCFINI